LEVLNRFSCEKEGISMASKISMPLCIIFLFQKYCIPTSPAFAVPARSGALSYIFSFIYFRGCLPVAIESWNGVHSLGCVAKRIFCSGISSLHFNNLPQRDVFAFQSLRFITRRQNFAVKTVSFS